MQTEQLDGGKLTLSEEVQTTKSSIQILVSDGNRKGWQWPLFELGSGSCIRPWDSALRCFLTQWETWGTKATASKTRRQMVTWLRITAGWLQGSELSMEDHGSLGTLGDTDLTVKSSSYRSPSH